MKLVRIVCILLFTLTSLSSIGQDLKEIYFKLERGQYEMAVDKTLAHIKTKRLVTIYTFTIPCKCVKHGSLYFYRHSNPETGQIFEPVRTNQLKRMPFINYDDLIKILKENDVDFNSKYILYFVEPGRKNYVYHVFKGTHFADDYVDFIITDSVGNILPYVE